MSAITFYHQVALMRAKQKLVERMIEEGADADAIAKQKEDVKYFETIVDGYIARGQAEEKKFINR